MQKEHEDLLCLLVEAARSVTEKQPFYALGPALGDTQGEVIHSGIPGRKLAVYPGDVQDLADLGLIAIRHYGQHGEYAFDVSPAGFAVCEQVHSRAGERVEQLPETMRAFMASSVFRSRHPGAFDKWLAADSALWSADTDARVTEIGHLCRESLQLFANGLLTSAPAADADPDPTHTVARVRSVLGRLKPKTSEKVYAFLDALLAYWGCVNDLVQRQEHGALKEGENLTWEDARRVVFQTMIVMYEVDREVAGSLQRGRGI